MSRIKTIIAAFVVTLGLGALAFAPASVVTAVIDPGKEAQDGIRAAGGGEGDGGVQLERAIRDVINVLLYVIGAVAVIMIVIGGIRYTISNGDSGQITSAKNTILYAVIGLVVALLAYAIVNFVVDAF